MTLAGVTTRSDDDEDLDGLGNLIRQAREQAGMRQTDLAAAVHAGLSAVSSWELGKHTPSAEKILAIAEATGVRFVADVDGQWRLEGPDVRLPVGLRLGAERSSRRRRWRGR